MSNKESLAEKEADTVGTPEVKIPEIGKEGWQEYIMSLFTEDELDKGNPKVDALFRVCEEVLGEITDAYPHTIQSPTPDNGYRAVVEFRVTVRGEDGGIPKFRFGEVADACPENIPDIKFHKYPTAIASTRAFGRALRRLLRLRNVIAAEEVTGESTDSNNDTEKATDEHFIYLDMICEKHNVSPSALFKKEYPHCKSVKDAKESEVKTLFNILKTFAQTKDVPEELKGYKSNWRNELA